jgi:hypothetical protein
LNVRYKTRGKGGQLLPEWKGDITEINSKKLDNEDKE